MDKKYFLILLFSLTFFFLSFVVFIGNEFIFAEKTEKNVPNQVSGSNPEMASDVNEIHSSNNLKNAEMKSDNPLVREGIVIQSQHVLFRMVGNRVMMSSLQDSSHFLCLENLNLERIINTMQKTPTMTDWQVDYLVTEYRGENYALIQRAILTSLSSQAKETKRASHKE
jgi:hypothetical protein